MPILPVQVTFRNVASKEGIEEEIRAQARKLESFYPRITGCRVTVEAPARHRLKGYAFRVRIDLTLPQGEIVVKREPSLRPVEGEKKTEPRDEPKHVEIAIRDSFSAARRRLQDYARKSRLDVKSHAAAARGRVSKLLPNQRYGYLETSDGREIYFHANSLLNKDFKGLELGATVSFVEEAGEKGPQASTVKVIARARPATGRVPARTGPSRATTKRAR